MILISADTEICGYGINSLWLNCIFTLLSLLYCKQDNNKSDPYLEAFQRKIGNLVITAEQLQIKFGKSWQLITEVTVSAFFLSIPVKTSPSIPPPPIPITVWYSFWTPVLAHDIGRLIITDKFHIKLIKKTQRDQHNITWCAHSDK